MLSKHLHKDNLRACLTECDQPYSSVHWRYKYNSSVETRDVYVSKVRVGDVIWLLFESRDDLRGAYKYLTSCFIYHNHIYNLAQYAQVSDANTTNFLRYVWTIKTLFKV